MEAYWGQVLRKTTEEKHVSVPLVWHHPIKCPEDVTVQFVWKLQCFFFAKQSTIASSDMLALLCRSSKLVYMLPETCRNQESALLLELFHSWGEISLLRELSLWPLIKMEALGDSLVLSPWLILLLPILLCRGMFYLWSASENAQGLVTILCLKQFTKSYSVSATTVQIQFV